DEVAGVHGAVDGALDALLEVRDQIPCVAAEDLVTALAAEQYLPVLPRQPRDHVLRERARSSDREVQVVDDLLDLLHEVGVRDVDLVQGKATMPRHFPRVAALVVAVAK